jgi:uncharacterized PurR-regulated membrane protein YhhQ (DUF165 family)
MKGKVKVISMGLLFIIVAFVRWNMMREMPHTSGSGEKMAYWKSLKKTSYEKCAAGQRTYFFTHFSEVWVAKKCKRIRRRRLRKHWRFRHRKITI